LGVAQDFGSEERVHAELVNQAKQGDREAFDALARLTGDRGMAIAFRILRDFDHADDAVQAALLTAWREIRALRDPELFPSSPTVIYLMASTPDPPVFTGFVIFRPVLSKMGRMDDTGAAPGSAVAPSESECEWIPR
jgi:hypothetical protein